MPPLIPKSSLRLPDFLIIGAQKAGTSFLYNTLTGFAFEWEKEKTAPGHPFVDPASVKKLHFFDTNKFFKGAGWYSAQFPKERTLTEFYGDGEPPRLGRLTITGESSPYYLFHPLAARRAAATVPEAKLIVLLRDPVERAYSDWRHTVWQDNEPLGFEEAIKAEDSRLAGETEKMVADERYKSPNHRRYSYLARGLYVDQLKEWHKHFDPEQFLIIESGDLYAEPERVLGRVQRFLGVPEMELEATRSANVSTARESESEISVEPPRPETWEWLREYFEPHNQRLYEYLGRDFGW